jgi:hypothetical protein
MWADGRRALLLSAPLALYLAALNPYFLPGVFDNVTYYFSAQSIATQGLFEFQGEPVRRWPPLFPLMLAALQRLGLEQVWVGKLFVVACAALSAWLLCGQFERERRPAPLLHAAAWLCLPWSLLVGADLLAEWPCIALSLLFLRVLPRLSGERHTLRWALCAGALLGAAGLTRWLAVLLAASLLFQAAGKLRARRALSGVLPELLAGLVGGALVLGWVVFALGSFSHIPFVADTYAAVTDVVYPTERAAERWFYAMPAPMRAAELATNLLFFHTRPFEAFGLLSPSAHLVVLLPAGLMLLGLGVRARRRELSPSDAFVVATVLLLSWKALAQLRYWVPLAPFLMHYALLGLETVVTQIARRPVQLLGARAMQLALAVWLAWLVTVDGMLLVNGNGRTYGGLTLLSSPSAERFYRGYWRDLYTVAQSVRLHPELAPVAVLGHPGAVRYVLAFSGRAAQVYPGRAAPGSVLLVRPAPLPSELRQRGAATPESESGSLTLYRTAPRHR